MRVVEALLLDGPPGEGVVKHFKTDTSAIVHFFSEDSISGKFFDQASLHLQEVIKRTDVFVDMLLGEVVVVGLNAEVFVDLSLFSSEETFDLLNACLLNK